VTAALEPDGRRVVIVNGDRTVHRWDGRTGEPVTPLPRPAAPEGESRGRGHAAIAPDCRSVLLAGTDRTARLWDVDGKPLGPPLRHAGGVRQVALSADGRTALTGWDRVAQLWDAVTGRAVGPPLAHAGLAGPMTFSPDGWVFVTTSDDGTAWLRAVPALDGDPRRVMLWAQVVTGLELDRHGAVLALDADTLAARRRELETLGGPPLP
jgi:WD40 repeat protein